LCPIRDQILNIIPGNISGHLFSATIYSSILNY
jgi:hypothetical protein